MSLAALAVIRRVHEKRYTDRHTIQDLKDEGEAILVIESALRDWELIKDEPVVVGRLAIIKLAAERRKKQESSP